MVSKGYSITLPIIPAIDPNVISFIASMLWFSTASTVGLDVVVVRSETSFLEKVLAIAYFRSATPSTRIEEDQMPPLNENERHGERS